MFQITQNPMRPSLSVPLIDVQACDVDGTKKVEVSCEGSAASGPSTVHTC